MLFITHNAVRIWIRSHILDSVCHWFLHQSRCSFSDRTPRKKPFIFQCGQQPIHNFRFGIIVGVSNTLSVDIFKNHVFKEFTPKQIVYVGKAVSLVTMCLCVAFAILLYEDTDGDYGSVYTIQQGLLWQVNVLRLYSVTTFMLIFSFCFFSIQSVPAYVFGLYTNLSANSVLTGTSLGVVTCIILISVVFSNEGAHDPFPLVVCCTSLFILSLSVFLCFSVFL